MLPSTAVSSSTVSSLFLAILSSADLLALLAAELHLVWISVCGIGLPPKNVFCFCVRLFVSTYYYSVRTLSHIASCLGRSTVKGILLTLSYATNIVTELMNSVVVTLLFCGWQQIASSVSISEQLYNFLLSSVTAI